MKFLELTRLEDNTEVILALDEISSIVVDDKYRPNWGSIVRTKEGTTFHVTKSVRELTAIISKLVDDE